jgi:hypothetical protein
MTIIRDQCTLKTTPTSPAPRWQPQWEESCIPARQATEVADNWTTDRAPDPGRPFAHMFDMTTQHLSAAGAVTVAVNALRHRTRPLPPEELSTTNEPGYYRVTIPEARELAGYLPHPAGRYRPGDTVWVAHPTLDLLVRCAQTYRIMALPDVLEAWTAPGTRVFRAFAQRMSVALKEAGASYGELDQTMMPTLKQVYQSMTGLMETPGPGGAPRRIYRPDWSHAIKAQARVELWRKMHLEGTTGSGRWPIEVTADGVWYTSATPDPDWPATFRRSDPGGPPAPGAFVVKKTKEITT